MPRQVTVNVNQTELPNNITYQAGNVVVLTDDQWAQVSPTAILDGTLTDGGNVALGGHKVTVNVANVELPNKIVYQANQQATLTQDEFSRLSTDLFTNAANPGRTVTAAASTTNLTVAAGGFTVSDVGRVVTDSTTPGNIPANTKIVSITSPTVAVVNNSMTTFASDTVVLAANGTLVDNGAVAGGAHKVTVNVANVELPNKITYQATQTAILAPDLFDQLSPAVFTDGTLTDNGIV